MADFLKHLDEIQKITLQACERTARRVDNLEAELSRTPGSGGGYGESKTLFDQFASVADQTQVKNLGRGRLQVALGTSLFAAELKTTITSSAVGSSTPGILIPQRMAGIVAPGVAAFRIRDLIPRYQTSSNAVEFVKENAFTNAASPVAETISKPESALTFTIDHSLVKTLAHWIPASRQILDDFAGLRPYLDRRLLDGLRDVEDYELVAGDGTGQHLSGLATEATAYDTARNVAADTKIDRLLHGISQVEDVKLRPSGIIMNPADWRSIQLIKTDEGGANTGTYLLGGPVGTATPTLWGLPVATSPAVAVGKWFVGAFQTHTALWDRMDARVELSTEHQDFFIRNLVAILCEERIALTVTRSDAVVYGAF